MQVEAIYNQGIIELSQPLRLKHNNVRLVVTVPDDEIEAQDEFVQTNVSEVTKTKTGSTTLRARIDAILAPYQDQLSTKQAFTPNDYKKMWVDHLEEKYLGRR
jgi:predicted DNA-binding antitoxin AbrB/MazE fold protein